MGQVLTKLSLQEFVEWENQQTERHELHRGSVIAMVGERRVHGLIALNIASSLHGQLKGSRCQVFTGSMKVKVGAMALGSWICPTAAQGFCIEQSRKNFSRRHVTTQGSIVNYVSTKEP
jgi:hypothetical protein